MQALGIKETLDIYDAADATSNAIIASCENNKIGLEDLKNLVAPARAAVEAVKGRQLIGAELKDLDATELETIVNRSVATTTNLIYAVERLAAVLGAKIVA